MNPDLEKRVPREILAELIEEGTEAFRGILEKLFNVAMQLERSEFLGAARNMSITLRHFLSRISVVSVHESSWLGRLIQTAAGRDGGTGCPLGNRSGDRAKAACRA